jgi:drug/metabolite transporter (DMT)-like permease
VNRLTGIILIIISAVAFGTLPIFGRLAYANGLDTITFLFLRFLFASLLLVLIMILRREPVPIGRALGMLILMGALGYAAQSFTYLSAVKYASAGLVALLLYLYPTFVVILSAVFLHEKVTRLTVTALVIALLGTALTVGPAGGQAKGIALAIASALIYSIYIIIGSGVMKHVSAIQSSTVIFASAGVVYGIMILANGTHLPSGGTGWLVVFGTVIFATVIPVVTFLAGLERIGPTNAAMLSTLEPVVTVLLATWLLDEQLQPVTLLGGGMIIAAVVLLARSELRKPETTAHLPT